MNNICCIYKITNIINNKLYIGQTWNCIKKRFSDHKNPSKKGCVKLHNAFNKYGRDNFTIELLTITHTQESSNYWEAYFIEKYDTTVSGYNIRNGGSLGGHSIETKLKLSLYVGPLSSFYGKYHSIESKRKISLGHVGKTISEESKQKMSQAKTGVMLTTEHKEKIGLAHKNNKHARGCKHSEEHNAIKSERSKGEKNPFFGRSHSNETKRKLVEANKDRYTGKTWKLIDGKRVWSSK